MSKKKAKKAKEKEISVIYKGKTMTLEAWVTQTFGPAKSS